MHQLEQVHMGVVNKYGIVHIVQEEALMYLSCGQRQRH